MMNSKRLRYFGQNSQIMRIVFLTKPEYLFDLMIFLFLSTNLVLRLNELIQIRSYIILPAVLVIIAGFYINFRPKHLGSMLFVFGLSFPLYGSRSFSINSQMFELLLAILCLTFFFLNKGGRNTKRLNKQIVYLFLLYSVLSALSLLLLPIQNLFEIFSLWDIYSMTGLLLNSTPDTYFYSLTAVNRLVLFLIFIFQLSKMVNAEDLYKHLFIGIAVGCVLAMLFGLIEYYDLFSLNWMRPNYRKISLRLQSTFENPGWFAEYVIVTIPFTFDGFFGKRKSHLMIFFLFSILILCAVVLVFTKSRASWIIYLFILICFFTILCRINAQNNLGLRLKKIGIIKILISAPLIILISLFIGNHFISKYIGFSEKKKIKSRFDQLMKPADAPRLKIWRDTLHLSKENIFFGMGYESFRWHSGVLNEVTESDFAKHRAKDDKLLETPHNFFLQLLLSGGLAGIFIWIVLTGYVLLLLYYDFIENRHELNISVILSIITFHMYGMFQSMQYIPMIWFLIFLNFGYAMVINENILPRRIKIISKQIVVAFCVLLFVGCISYLQNMESKKMVEKYGLKTYAKNQKGDKFIGFYNLEKWEEGNYRWSGGKGIIRFDGGGLRELNFKCLHPDVEIEPVKLSVFLNDEPLDQIVFSEKGTVKRKYHIPDQQRKVNEMLIKVSRTWNPRKYGSSDNRNIGVAVSEMKLGDKTAPY